MDKTFLAGMRRNSAYPTYRGFVWLATGIGYLMAVVVALFAVVAGTGGGKIKIIMIVEGCFVAILVCVIVTIAREVSLMVADIADAAISLASRQADPMSSSRTQSQDHVNKDDPAALVRNQDNT